MRGPLLLHIGAADQVLDCYADGRHIGTHTGGYEAMTFELSCAPRAEFELVLRVRDDLRSTVLPYGKQVMQRGGMWYTPVSGIWQTVWMESVPEHAVRALDIQADCETAVIDTRDETLTGTVTVETPGGALTVPLERGKAEVHPPEPRLWSPESPHLYRFVLETQTDRVESYFALRTIEAKTVNGRARLCLNGKPYFFHGVLDQGYYSDGLYTPASPECMERDIRTMKALGFNTLRKHIKVEPEQYYYLCDCLGMAVFQDMVNNGDYSYVRDTVLPNAGVQRRRDVRMHRDEAARRAFLDGMAATVRQLKNHPCIVYWTIFNEGGDSLIRPACTPNSAALTRAASWTRRPAGSAAARRMWTAATSTSARGGFGRVKSRSCSRSSAGAALRCPGICSTRRRRTGTARPKTARHSKKPS